MLTAEQFDTLEKGDLVELSPLLKGLTDDPVTLYTSKRDGNRLEFVATFMGITLGRWTATKAEGEIKWQTW
jgi:hypothetical protein